MALFKPVRMYGSSEVEIKDGQFIHSVRDNHLLMDYKVSNDKTNDTIRRVDLAERFSCIERPTNLLDNSNFTRPVNTRYTKVTSGGSFTVNGTACTAPNTNGNWQGGYGGSWPCDRWFLAHSPAVAYFEGNDYLTIDIAKAGAKYRLTQVLASSTLGRLSVPNTKYTCVIYYKDDNSGKWSVKKSGSGFSPYLSNQMGSVTVGPDENALLEYRRSYLLTDADLFGSDNDCGIFLDTADTSATYAPLRFNIIGSKKIKILHVALYVGDYEDKPYSPDYDSNSYEEEQVNAWRWFQQYRIENSNSDSLLGRVHVTSASLSAQFPLVLLSPLRRTTNTIFRARTSNSEAEFRLRGPYRNNSSSQYFLKPTAWSAIGLSGNDYEARIGQVTLRAQCDFDNYYDQWTNSSPNSKAFTTEARQALHNTVTGVYASKTDGAVGGRCYFEFTNEPLGFDGEGFGVNS